MVMVGVNVLLLRLVLVHPQVVLPVTCRGGGVLGILITTGEPPEATIVTQQVIITLEVIDIIIVVVIIIAPHLLFLMRVGATSAQHLIYPTTSNVC